MPSRVLGRLLQVIPVLVLIGIAVFLLVRLLPGDPAAVLLGDRATPDSLARVRALGGALSVSSAPGRGTRFTLRMPLAWAVVPVLLVRAAARVYALPLAHVRGTRSESGGNAPALAALLGSAEEPSGLLPTRELVAVAAHDGTTLDVAVQEVIGTADCVLKPLTAPRGAFRVAVGATILDGGDVVLVLDAPAVVARRAARAPR